MSRGEPNSKTPLVGKQGDSLSNVKGQITDVQGVLRENMDMAIARGENINTLNDRTEQLESDSRTFKTRSIATRRKFCASYYRTIVLIVVILLVILGIIIYFATK